MDRKQLLLANMYTFSVAAKFLSFTMAAEELFITQGAVSQRIKSLEEQLGFTLFVRMTRRLELTAEGDRLLQALNQSFDVIFSEIEDIRFNELRGELYIGAAPTFAQSWLLPRLPKFQELYPNLNVKLRVKASRLDFQHEPVDLAIYYSEGNHPEFYSRRLFDETITPVCSNSYYQKLFGDQSHQTPDMGSKLKQATFIHCSESLEASEPNREWQLWLKSQSDDSLNTLNVLERTYIFNHSDMAMIAAKNGMGIAMARESLVTKSLKSGELIAPFENVYSGRGYDLICLNGQEHRPRIAAFIEWLQGECDSSASQVNIDG
ncbi:LysR substrate-binding domain-containing protein [Photobacterium lipolyticum]|uniref:LysR family transcriptional regulator n=1 Tax=Photobacterium lipolyticum TaxID=266810 RepID=A0A2T3N1D3_9GAMM|nr:LysR substrate-binding domain-containing protein [Photobacterium lipolyticum]PSW06130.1 LysR family transcriptional regulator [Photobacterium lipolyticum]